jgi:hypothetical protein
MTVVPTESPKGGGLRWMQNAVTIAALLFVVGSLCVVVLLRLRPKPFVLPFTVDDIASMEATFDPQVPETFQVPPSFWEPILAALSAGYKDDRGLKSEGFGSLDLQRKDGSPYVIILFSHDRFAAGRTSDERVYYRGADEVALHRVIMEAYEAIPKKRTADRNRAKTNDTTRVNR